MLDQPHIITYVIMAVTILVSVICLNNRELFEKLKHSPFREQNHGEYYRLLTSGFVHGSWLHLGVNMYVFYSFGKFTEAAISGYYTQFSAYAFAPAIAPLIYLALYLLTIVIANLPTLFQHKDNPYYGAIGASGAVSGATFCFILFLPWEMIYLYGIIGIYSIVAGVAFLIYSQYAAKKGGDNIDHTAHFYGALAMPIMLIALRPGLIGHFIEMLTTQRPF
ncbi:MAG: rhomboid family intramembrane serine protease [Saprospiraceae bacterium]